jgi:CheY-like chemotaxis protein
VPVRSHTPSPLLVLVVDDDAGLLYGACALLEGCGLRATPAASPEEAMALTEGEAPDVLVTDLELGPLSISGAELIAALRRKARPRLPAVLITEPEVAAAALRAAGVTAEVVRKPFTRDALTGAIAATLGRPRPGRHTSGSY